MVDRPSAPLILGLDSGEATLEQVGGKGASLARMAAAGLPVPPGFTITTAAYRLFVDQNNLQAHIVKAVAGTRADDPDSLERASVEIRAHFAAGQIPEDIAQQIRQAYNRLGEGDPAVAVRSSATAEDLPGMSFAGQQETYLNVHGAAAVLEAVKRCWASLWTARAIGYRAHQGIRPEEVSLAVVVQRLVPADVAGILFTAHPLTGERDRMVINAAWGLGEAIVGGLVTPDTVVVDRRTAIIESQEIADKAVMTVRRENGTDEEPVPESRRRQAVLNAAQVAELARTGTQIEGLYGQAMDIEWAMQDDQLFVVQARPITALPEPAPTLEWKIPKPTGRYARASVIELLPDPLSPLFATLALPTWNDAMAGLLQAMGAGDTFGENMLITINDYAYYDFGLSPAQSARFLLLMPQMIVRVVPWLRHARERWEKEARPRYARVVQQWDSLDVRTAGAVQLLTGAQYIVRVAAQHYLTLQSGILPAAYMSETLFTTFYNRLIRRPGDPSALTFLLGYESTPIQAEESLYDLAMWAGTQPGLSGFLTRASSAQIAAAYGDPAVTVEEAGEAWAEFRRRLAQHLARFGHTIYDLDFAKAVPAEEPAPLLEALKFFLSGQAPNPHERQATAARAREQAVQAVLARLKGARRTLFRRTLGPAQRFAPLREDALADVGLGWPLLRRMFQEIGRRLAAAGAVDDPGDVFWLQWNELQAAGQALDGDQPVTDYRPRIAQRRATWTNEDSVTPPLALPLKEGMKFMGVDWSSFAPARIDQSQGDTIRGIGASPGRVTGPARVIRGPGEFGQMQHGDILVAPITTPAWTPLFALAGGVVTDIGGPLSHGSIVAREYRIPAVLGTHVATERIHSSQRVIVDGDAGTVTVAR